MPSVARRTKQRWWAQGASVNGDGEKGADGGADDVPGDRLRMQSLAFDEYGRPFLILREQEKKKRLKGIEAQRANIAAAKSVSRILRTSLGPKGMDKMMQGPDGDVMISTWPKNAIRAKVRTTPTTALTEATTEQPTTVPPSWKR